MAKGNKQNSKQGDSASNLYCKYVDCKEATYKFGFCKEHYEWFMAGVIKGNGEKPSDFEAKLSQYLKKKKSAA